MTTSDPTNHWIIDRRSRKPSSQVSRITWYIPRGLDIDGRQDPSLVPDSMVWGMFFERYHQTHYANVEALLTREDAAALRNGGTQWVAIRDQDNLEVVNDLTDLVGRDVDSIDPFDGEGFTQGGIESD